MSEPSSLTSLGEAKDWLRGRIDNGERCPCCTQFAKVYKRSIHATMARGLIAMYQAHGQNWHHLLRVGANKGGDEAKLGYWGLIEQELERAADGNPHGTGYWRVTDLGVRFLRDEVELPKYARVYDGRLLGLVDEPKVSIKDCLGTKFNYAELMAAV